MGSKQRNSKYLSSYTWLWKISYSEHYYNIWKEVELQLSLAWALDVCDWAV